MRSVRWWILRAVVFWAVETACLYPLSYATARIFRYVPPGEFIGRYLLTILRPADVAAALAIAVVASLPAMGGADIMRRLAWRRTENAAAVHAALALLSVPALFFTLVLNTFLFAPVVTPAGLLQNLVWRGVLLVLLANRVVRWTVRRSAAGGLLPGWLGAAIALDVFCFGGLYVIEIVWGLKWDAPGLAAKLAMVVPSAALGWGVYALARRPRAARVALATLVALIVLGAGATTVSHWRTGRRPPLSRSAETPDILLVVIDTTRAEALGCYGAKAPFSDLSPTPHIDRIAREGRVFDSAWATSNWTLPSHASMFTGLYPVSHNTHWEHLYLTPEIPTLAEHLRARGYETAGFSENPWVGPSSGMDRGFDDYWAVGMRDRTPRAYYLWEHIAHRFAHRDTARAELAVRRFVPWLDARTTDRPYFVFLNLLSPHTPYLPPKSWLDAYLPDPSEREWAAHFEQDAIAFVAGREELPPAQWDVLRRLYQGEVSWTDAQVGNVYSHLRETGRLDSTLVIVVADHGENIGEQRHDVTGKPVWQHSLSHTSMVVGVPLLVRYPGHVEPGTRTDMLTSVLDIPVTVLAEAGAAPLPQAVGIPLWGVESDAARAARTGVLAQSARPLPDLRNLEKTGVTDLSPFDRRVDMYITGARWYARDSGGRRFLYDLRTDFLQEHNLVESDAATTAHLDAALTQLLAVQPPPRDGGAPPVAMDPETIEALENLGYIAK